MNKFSFSGRPFFATCKVVRIFALSLFFCAASFAGDLQTKNGTIIDPSDVVRVEQDGIVVQPKRFGSGAVRYPWSFLSEETISEIKSRFIEKEKEGQGEVSAFGLAIGSRVDPSLTSTKQITDTLFEFSPKNPLPTLSEYTFEITPGTSIVYTISASGRFDSEEAAERERVFISEVLKKKFANQIADSGSISNHGLDVLYFNSKNIRISRMGNEVFLEYLDSSLERQAYDERMAIEESRRKIEMESKAKSVDTSGL